MRFSATHSVLIFFLLFGFLFLTATASTEEDFSSPRATVKTFIAAAGAKDKALLQRCFAAQAPGEFASFRDGHASDEDIAELGDFTNGATVGEESIEGRKAWVSVNFTTRDETIELVKVEDSWLILDF